LGFSGKMETLLEETDEDKKLLERELSELMEVTFKMEYELELALQEAESEK
jgi:hypothetical protein